MRAGGKFILSSIERYSYDTDPPPYHKATIPSRPGGRSYVLRATHDVFKMDVRVCDADAGLWPPQEGASAHCSADGQWEPRAFVCVHPELDEKASSTRAALVSPGKTRGPALDYNIAKSIVRACCRWLDYAPGDADCRWYDELAEDEAMGEEAQPTGEQLRCAPCDESDDEMGLSLPEWQVVPGWQVTQRSEVMLV